MGITSRSQPLEEDEEHSRRKKKENIKLKMLKSLFILIGIFAIALSDRIILDEDEVKEYLDEVANTLFDNDDVNDEDPGYVHHDCSGSVFNKDCVGCRWNMGTCCQDKNCPAPTTCKKGPFLWACAY